MAFMYLHLRYAHNERGYGSGVRASVRTDGNLRSLGTENSRFTEQPFAVFALSEFDGLENVETGTLIELLLQRMSASDLLKQLKYKLTFDELIELLRSSTRNSG